MYEGLPTLVEQVAVAEFEGEVLNQILDLQKQLQVIISINVFGWTLEFVLPSFWLVLVLASLSLNCSRKTQRCWNRPTNYSPAQSLQKQSWLKNKSARPSSEHVIWLLLLPSRNRSILSWRRMQKFWLLWKVILVSKSWHAHPDDADVVLCV